MRIAPVKLISAALLIASALRADPRVVPLWSGDAPGSEGVHGEELWVERGEGIVDRSVANVDKPTLTVYLPLPEKSNGSAVVICPGGAYTHLAIDKEGHDIAKWLTANGIAGIVLKYRLPRTKERSYTVDTALADAQRAMRIARSRAVEWKIDPNRIGMMGFSAGGNLISLAGTKFDDGQPGAKDTIDRAASRPDFLALIYPSVPENLTIHERTPPSFLVHADDDRLSSENSVRFYRGLKKAKIPAELHIYSRGGHGFGILNRDVPSASWPMRFLAWMGAEGLLKH
jgi:acetyl esterase/lipase